MRNVAHLAELPAWERKPSPPWTAAEARAFLDAASDDPLCPACVLLLLYGLRRGDVLGLRWRDVDEEDGELSRLTWVELSGLEPLTSCMP